MEQFDLTDNYRQVKDVRDLVGIDLVGWRCLSKPGFRISAPNVEPLAS